VRPLIFIVEYSGERRAVWGPYATIEKAREEARSRHVVVESSHIRNGQILTRTALLNLQQIGIVIPVDAGVVLA